MSRHGLRAAFFAEIDSKAQHRRHGISERLQSFVEAPESVLEPLDYPDTLSKSSLEESLRLMLSETERE